MSLQASKSVGRKGEHAQAGTVETALKRKEERRVEAVYTIKVREPLSVMGTEISVCRHYKVMSFRQKY